MKKNFIHIYVIILFAVLFPNIITSQQEPDSLNENFIQKNFKINGEVGVYGELYSINGQPKRRPSSTGRIYFRPVINLFNSFNIPFDFLISSEGSHARQNINQYGINPNWGWGTAHLGDFTDSFSELTLNGIMVRGAGVNISPGIFRFGFVSGFTQTAVPGGASNGKYERFLVGGKLGIGKENGSFFDLIVLKARDNVSSLEPVKPGIKISYPNGDDVLPIGTLQNIRWLPVNLSGSVNIEVSRDGGLSFETILSDQPNTGSAFWNVTGPETFQAILRIRSNADSSIYDQSDYVFTIASGVQQRTGNLLLIPENPTAVMPQENLVMGLNGNIQFLQNKIALKTELTGSIYTRDLNSSVIDIDSINLPKSVNKIFKPRVGTNADFALNSALQLNFGFFNGTVGYKKIGAGYNSLGLAYVLNDQEELSAMTNFRFSKFSLMLNWMNANDNLLDQKLSTTKRNNYTISLYGNILQMWNSNITANILNMNNDAAYDSAKTKFSNFMLSFNNSFILGTNSLFRNLSLNYNYQTSDNDFAMIKNSTKIHTINMGLNLFPEDNFSVTPNYGIILSDFTNQNSTTTNIISLGSQLRLLKYNLTSGLNISYSILENNKSLRTSLNNSYNLSMSDIISLVISMTNFTNSSSSVSDFTEWIGSLNISHRF